MISGIAFERIPNIGLNGIPKYHSQEQIDQIKYQIIQNNSNYLHYIFGGQIKILTVRQC